MGFVTPVAWHATLPLQPTNPHKPPTLSSPSPSCTFFYRGTSGFLGYMRVLLARGGCSTSALLPSLQGTAAAAGLSSSGVMPVAEWHRQYHNDHSRRKEKDKESVVVIMGATGTGKSKLSIDIATRFGGEVVNSDKIQVYRGLDITTNKIPIPDRGGVPHHLLGNIDPAQGELSPAGFRALASKAISAISRRRKVPVVAGGSNSFSHALVSEPYDPRADPYCLAMGRQRFKYRCCFLWVDVEKGPLEEHLDRRVDEMVEAGMVAELERYFAATGEGEHQGLGKAIGVAEFKDYFVKEGKRERGEYEGALGAIKENTRRLAEAQVGKIKRLGERGWELLRVDATGAVRARLCGAGRAAQEVSWDRDVLGPSVEAVRRFLDHHQSHRLPVLAPPLVS